MNRRITREDKRGVKKNEGKELPYGIRSTWEVKSR